MKKIKKFIFITILNFRQLKTGNFSQFFPFKIMQQRVSHNLNLEK